MNLQAHKKRNKFNPSYDYISSEAFRIRTTKDIDEGNCYRIINTTYDSEYPVRDNSYYIKDSYFSIYNLNFILILLLVLVLILSFT